MYSITQIYIQINEQIFKNKDNVDSNVQEEISFPFNQSDEEGFDIYPYDKLFWEKSDPGREKKKKTNSLLEQC